jgi:hypothetical protein
MDADLGLSVVVLVIGLLPAARGDRAPDDHTTSDLTHTTERAE